MTTSPEWVPEVVAGEQLAMKPSTLRCMRRERRLRPGIDWIYSTGGKHSSVLYNVPSIIELLVQRTIEATQKEDARREARLKNKQERVEIYEEGEA
ncbi:MULTISPECIES: hypothetical protein [unclassified Prochlorococcus]|uniref:hypothetical protein n=1 Tax=unclassified Prochlorococcus TaxID=2627481 RepID=UPI00145F3E3A|nr:MULTISPECIES: hypothetical protein [unclassified Prochlorococcus]NMO84308.1 hypothetical protein [Prochlorococcus sp. P1344]NMP13018.1 hypothetical protein [Prochlorococcus sp.P1363]